MRLYGAADEHVVTRAADQHVAAVPADEDVGSGATFGHAPDRPGGQAGGLHHLVAGPGPGRESRARRPGSGLEGLAQRVEALDGTLAVTSPPGGPTTITAWLPCAS